MSKPNIKYSSKLQQIAWGNNERAWIKFSPVDFKCETAIVEIVEEVQEMTKKFNINELILPII